MSKRQDSILDGMQIRSRSSASDLLDLSTEMRKAAPRLQFLAGAYISSTCAALHLFNTSAFIVSPAQLELRQSLADELRAFDIQV